MNAEFWAMWLIPAITVGTLVWRLSTRLAQMDAKLDRLEAENRRLHAELDALRTLMTMFVDKRTASR